MIIVVHAESCRIAVEMCADTISHNPSEYTDIRSCARTWELGTARLQGRPSPIAHERSTWCHSSLSSLPSPPGWDARNSRYATQIPRNWAKINASNNAASDLLATRETPLPSPPVQPVLRYSERCARCGQSDFTLQGRSAPRRRQCVPEKTHNR